ncbi:MAG: type II toxin-antitoxin system VapC family toxin [Coleofasciculaceae cyanobacterium RL_1_1]|nr:type II toxin-antitoxin system VapC family toxin [Coleofasciculaceae cyanobacterium RL_1_1]
MKLILDTNVVSELIQPMGSVDIRAWLARQNRSELYITSVTQAELLYGIEILPIGQRRQRLLDGTRRLFDQYLADRILPFDHVAAEVYAQLAASRRRRGHPMSQFDGQIAAICYVHQAGLATRNVRDFLDCGIALVNPWEYKDD